MYLLALVFGILLLPEGMNDETEILTYDAASHQREQFFAGPRFERSIMASLIFTVYAYPLKCHECLSGARQDCNEMVECPLQGQKCGSLRILTYAGIGTASDLITKSCFLTHQCVEGSFNFGLARTHIMSKCCSTDLCNAGSFNASVIEYNPNGKKCFTCNDPRDSKCTATLDCKGTEDRCMSSTVKVGRETVTMKGCASKQICSNHEQVLGLITGQASCCKGNLCNSASSTGAILPLTLAALLASVMT